MTEVLSIFKLRLGALISRSVGLSVGLLVCLSVGPSKITKYYKTLQNLSKHYKTLKNDQTRILPPPFHVRRLPRKLRQYAGASLTESSFLILDVRLNRFMAPFPIVIQHVKLRDLCIIFIYYNVVCLQKR